MSAATARGHATASRAMVGEVACGDRVGVFGAASSDLLCVADGTGHGAAAATAAEAAIAHIDTARELPLVEIVAGCHRALARTRGVALGLARVHPDGQLEYAGVGNTRALVASTRTVLLPSTPGIVGSRYPSVRVQRMALAPGDLVLLATDAFPESIDLGPYAPLRCDLDALVHCLLDDQASTRDDAAILAYRAGGA